MPLDQALHGLALGDSDAPAWRGPVQVQPQEVVGHAHVPRLECAHDLLLHGVDVLLDLSNQQQVVDVNEQIDACAIEVLHEEARVGRALPHSHRVHQLDELQEPLPGHLLQAVHCPSQAQYLVLVATLVALGLPHVQLLF